MNRKDQLLLETKTKFAVSSISESSSDDSESQSPEPVPDSKLIPEKRAEVETSSSDSSGSDSEECPVLYGSGPATKCVIQKTQCVVKSELNQYSNVRVNSKQLPKSDSNQLLRTTCQSKGSGNELVQKPNDDLKSKNVYESRQKSPIPVDNSKNKDIKYVSNVDGRINQSNKESERKRQECETLKINQPVTELPIPQNSKTESHNPSNIILNSKLKSSESSSESETSSSESDQEIVQRPSNAKPNMERLKETSKPTLVCSGIAPTCSVKVNPMPELKYASINGPKPDSEESTSESGTSSHSKPEACQPKFISTAMESGRNKSVSTRSPKTLEGENSKQRTMSLTKQATSEESEESEESSDSEISEEKPNGKISNKEMNPKLPPTKMNPVCDVRSNQKRVVESEESSSESESASEESEKKERNEPQKNINPKTVLHHPNNLSAVPGLPSISNPKPDSESEETTSDTSSEESDSKPKNESQTKTDSKTLTVGQNRTLLRPAPEPPIRNPSNPISQGLKVTIKSSSESDESSSESSDSSHDELNPKATRELGSNPKPDTNVKNTDEAISPKCPGKKDSKIPSNTGEAETSTGQSSSESVDKTNEKNSKPLVKIVSSERKDAKKSESTSDTESESEENCQVNQTKNDCSKVPKTPTDRLPDESEGSHSKPQLKALMSTKEDDLKNPEGRVRLNQELLEVPKWKPHTCEEKL